MSIFRSTIPSQYQFNNMTDFTHIKTDYIHVTTNLSNQYSTRLPFHGKSEPTIIVNTLVIFHVFQHNAQVPIHSDIFPNSRPVNARQGYKQKFKFVTASQAEKNKVCQVDLFLLQAEDPTKFAKLQKFLLCDVVCSGLEQWIRMQPRGSVLWQVRTATPRSSHPSSRDVLEGRRDAFLWSYLLTQEW